TPHAHSHILPAHSQITIKSLGVLGSHFPLVDFLKEIQLCAESGIPKRIITRTRIDQTASAMAALADKLDPKRRGASSDRQPTMSKTLQQPATARGRRSATLPKPSYSPAIAPPGPPQLAGDGSLEIDSSDVEMMEEQLGGTPNINDPNSREPKQSKQ